MNQTKKSHRYFIRSVFIAMTVISICIYIITSKSFYKIGFPLDDAWIHQTFARNLATFGEWSFIPGTPSAGSTSPFWSAVLTVGYIFNLGPYIWTFVLGGVLLFLSGLIGESIATNLYPSDKPLFPYIGALIILEWHLVWASVSGMETMLFIIICLSIFWILISSRKWSWFFVGILTGASIWVRPEGITLAGVIFFVEVFSKGKITERFKQIGLTLLGITILLIPYLLFNYKLSGSVLPNTFFAKQAEYAILLQNSIFRRVLNLIPLPFIGVGILLIPGFLYQLYYSMKQKKLMELGMYLWFFGFILLYAIRLPVIYQHGRYLIPTIPVLLILGGLGTLKLIQMIRTNRFGFVLGTTFALSIGAVLIGFFIVGARTYDLDVAIIETEMVEPAKWIAVNTPANAIVAAHDIGALGFFGERSILDLAGLVSPEVIAFIRDESKLDAFIKDRKANYLMTFPDWYPELVAGKRLIFSSDGIFSPRMGGKNMAVYELNP